MTRLEEAALENFLEFNGRHRGNDARRADRIEVWSKLEEFRFVLLLGKPQPDTLARFRSVRTLPWAGPIGPELETAGFRKTSTLVFLVSRTEPLAIRRSSALTVETVRDEAALRTFSEVQTLGFLDPEEPFAELFSFLHRANACNLTRSEQQFLLGRWEGRPAGVTLLLDAAGLGGIYAVATLPDHRGRGIASALLGAALDEARARGRTQAVLQVIRGSAAERLYRRHGFAEVFISDIHAR